MSPTPRTVFLSYASEDVEPARRIRDALRAAGVEVWFDQNELRGGDAWDAAIRNRIRNCALFVPVISANTELRSEGYFRLEWKLAVDRSHMMSEDQAFLLPVALDGVPESSMRVPDRFREVQWSRPSHGESLDAFAQRARRLLDAPAETFSKPDLKLAAGGPSIAVLPFVNMSRDEDNAYFADGLSEELLNVLAGIRGLRVASRTSAFFFKGKALDLPTIAQKLNVATILEGSVRKAGSRVRITAQLIEVATDSHLWSQTYDRELDDIFAVQDDIAQSVVTELRRALFGDEAGSNASAVAEVRAAATGRTDNAEAHQLYLQGRFFLDRTGKDEVARAVDFFTKAIDLDPQFALAWSSLSTGHFIQGSHGWVPAAEGLERAREEASRAIEIAPDLAEGHVGMARVLLADYNWTAAATALQRALDLAPGSDYVLRAAARHASLLGRTQEAIGFLLKAVSLDPLSFAGHISLGLRYITCHRLEEAEVEFRTALVLHPPASIAHFCLFLVRLYRGLAEEALAVVQHEPLATLRLMGTALAHHTLGNDEQSNEALQRLVEEHGHSTAYEIAATYAWRGEADRAFEWIERAFAQRDAGLTSVLADPLLTSLHGDPRWFALLERLGLKDYFPVPALA